MTLPLNAASPLHYHVLQSLSLIILSLIFLPFSTFVALLSLAWIRINSLAHSLGIKVQTSPPLLCQPAEPQRTILVTGVGMAKGLHIARAFYQRGHKVIGADIEPWYIPVSGRFSCALSKYQRLPVPSAEAGAREKYVAAIVDLVRRESVDLWVTCSGVANPIQDAEAAEYVQRETDCRVFQHGVELTRKLHEKDLFVEEARRLGLNVPETHSITTVEQAINILYPHTKDLQREEMEEFSTDRARIEEKGSVTTLKSDSHSLNQKRVSESTERKRSYLMKSVFLDDSVRSNMTLLPKSTIQETYAHIRALRPSPTRTFVLQQFIAGNEYTTHSIVIQGKVVAFTACASADLLMHYKALPPSSPISRALQKYTELFAERTGWSMTGHLSIDFLLENEQGAETDDLDHLMETLFPIECNPRAHTAVVLFQDNALQMADAYLHLLSGVDLNSLEIVQPQAKRTYYWIGQDLVTEIFLPLLRWVTGRTEWDQVRKKWTGFAERLIEGREGTWVVWDPWPAWWLYSAYWPALLLCLMVTRSWWSRSNVSTCKTFRC